MSRIFFGTRSRQFHPVSRACIVLALFAFLSIFNTFRPIDSESGRLETKLGFRSLLSVHEDGSALPKEEDLSLEKEKLDLLKNEELQILERMEKLQQLRQERELTADEQTELDHRTEQLESIRTAEDVEVHKIEEVQEAGNDSGECIPAAITQFPKPMLDKRARQHGGVIFHILIATYMFLGLAIVCDEYFVPSLTRFSDALGLSPDVAGATFMAAGSSAPELATAVIGVFVAKDDIGVSGVVGSAVFNITLVIAVCALAAPSSPTLHWYPVIRDCFCYLVSIIILIFTIADSVVTWWESLFFLLTYVVYCVAMGFNKRFEAWATASLNVPDSWKTSDVTKTGEFSKWEEGGEKNGAANKDMEMKTNPDGTTEIKLTPVDEEKGKPELEGEYNPLKKPLALDDGKWAVFCWYVCFPLNVISVYTIPDCRKRQYSRWFIGSFFISVIWICLYSYVMVWMITVIGSTFGIPDTVMGLTFIAAGVSVPDALSGIAVIKEGHGDMAVSNAIGSNVFDILICLGIPWFCKTAIIEPGTIVEVKHKGILYSTFTLFSTVVFLIVACHVNNWKLDRKLGIILLVWYFVVMLFASLYETNILGNFNPVECESDY